MENRLLSTQICRDYPDRLAIVDNGGPCTYEDMHKGIRGLEKGFGRWGLKRAAV